MSKEECLHAGAGESESRVYRAFVILGMLAAVSCRQSQPVYRIGTNQNFPFNFVDEQGQPAGFGVEVVSEAAQRAAINLRWEYREGPPDVPLENGQLDLWPLVTTLETRRGKMHLTRPWWYADGVLLFRSDRPLRSFKDIGNRSIRTSMADTASTKKDMWPKGITLVRDGSPEEALSHVCRGDGDAVWMNVVVADRLLLERPAGCAETSLGRLSLPEQTVTLAIGAHLSKAGVADRLESEIREMALEGRVQQIATRWDLVRHSDSDLLANLRDASSRNLMLLYGLLAVCFAAAGLGWIALREHLASHSANRASEMRGQFLANMSHELRTPMNGVLGMIELSLGGRGLGSEQREYLEAARTSAKSLLAILNDILDLTRVDSGRLSLESIPFSVHEIAVRCARLMAPRAQEKRLELMLDIRPEVPEQLLGDPVRLQQILLNLLGNAVKFTHSGHVLLVVAGEDAGGDQLLLRCTVKDTGIGIGEKERERIFEPFIQADGSTTRRFGGSGLGLSVSRRLAEMMQGGITVQSESGLGSTFIFEGRFGKLAAGGQPLLSSPRRIAADLRNRQVLVVCANPTYRALLCDKLQSLGMGSTGCASTTEAWEQLEGRRGEYAVALVNCGPTAEQEEAALRLGSRLANEFGVPLLIGLVGAGEQPDQRQRLRMAGFADLLFKPVLSEDLAITIEGALGAGPEHTEVAPHRTTLTESTSNQHLRCLSVLVAEDNAINQLVARRLLERAGHRVRLAANGIEALAAIQEERFDLALFDVQMPEMSGLEAVAELRRRERASGAAHLPVIAVTAHALAGDRERFLEAGMDEYVAKPLDVEDLLSRIRTVTQPGFSVGRARSRQCAD